MGIGNPTPQLEGSIEEVRKFRNYRVKGEVGKLEMIKKDQYIFCNQSFLCIVGICSIKGRIYICNVEWNEKQIFIPQNQTWYQSSKDSKIGNQTPIPNLKNPNPESTLIPEINLYGILIPEITNPYSNRFNSRNQPIPETQFQKSNRDQLPETLF